MNSLFDTSFKSDLRFLLNFDFGYDSVGGKRADADYRADITTLSISAARGALLMGAFGRLM
jgi:hypothetical protein